MKLEDLPSVILRQILDSEESSWCVIELWKCGNRALNSRLANKGVTEIYLKDTEKDSTSRWPRCLREFALERLVVDRGYYGLLGTTLGLQRELQSLSSTLKSLDITGKGVAVALFYVPGPQNGGQSSSDKVDDVSDDEATDAPPSKRSKLVEDVSDQSHHGHWNLNKTWPQLERLKVFGEALRSDVFGASVLELLPRSLTHLDFGYAFDRSAYRDLSALPPGLKTLFFARQSIGLAGIKTLPKSITHLGDSVGEDGVAELFKRSKYLPNLIDVPSDMHDEVELLELVESGMPWPAKVQELKLKGVDDKHAYSKLPPNLTSLSTLGRYSPNWLTPRYIAGLPRTLQSFTLDMVEWRGIDVEHWPQTLTQLSVCAGGPYSAHWYSKFPRSLKSFDSLSDELHESIDPRTYKNLDKPTVVSKLKELGRECLALEAEQWAVEKARLLTPRYVALGSEAYIKRVEDGELFGLPLTLTKLDLAHGQLPLPYPGCVLLPPNIRDIGFIARIDDSHSFAFPPISSTDWVRAKAIIYGHAQNADADAFLNALPSASAIYRSNLTVLDVSFRTPGLKFSCFEYLPRTLTDLDFFGPAHIYHSELKHLPPNLKRLRILGALATPLEPWLHLLPNDLTYFQSPWPILGSEIINMPPKLETFYAHFHSVTLSQIRQVPHQLRHLHATVSDERAKAEARGVLHELAFKALQTLCRPFWRIREFPESLLKSELDIASADWPKLESTHHTAGEDENTTFSELSTLYPTVPADRPQIAIGDWDKRKARVFEDPLIKTVEGDEGEENVLNILFDAPKDEEEEADAEDDGNAGDEDNEEEDEDYEDSEHKVAIKMESILKPISDPSADLDPRTARRFATVTQ